jgi:hypothetical protein
MRCLAVLLLSIAFLAGASCGEQQAPAAPASTPRELLKYAPPGTYAVAGADVRSLRPSEFAINMWGGLDELASLLGQTPSIFGHSSLPPSVQLAYMPPEALVLFTYGPPDVKAESKARCGVAVFDEAEARKLLDVLKRRAEEGGRRRIKVSGLEAYTGWDLLLWGAFVDTRTALVGSSEDNLKTMIASYRAKEHTGLQPRLQAAAEPFVGDTAFGAYVRTADAGRAKGEPDATELAYGLRFDGSLEASFAATFATEAAAEAFRARAADFIRSPFGASDEPKEEPEGLRVLRSVGLSVEGRKFRAQLHMTAEQVRLVEAGFTAEHERRNLLFAKSEGYRQLHGIMEAISEFRNAQHEDYPPNLRSLIERGYLKGEGIDIRWPVEPPITRGKKALEESYAYVGPIPSNAPPEIIIVYSRKGIYPGERNTSCVDSAIRFATEAELHDPKGQPRTSLAASYRLLMDRIGGELTQEDVARLRQFYEIEE